MAQPRSGAVFNPTWLGIAVGLGLTLQLGGWLIGVGLLTGLPAYFFIGVVTAWGSPGSTLVEPGLAAFLIATVGFMIDHVYLTVLGVGIPIALAYGAVGFGVSIGGAALGERVLD